MIEFVQGKKRVQVDILVVSIPMKFITSPYTTAFDARVLTGTRAFLGALEISVIGSVLCSHHWEDWCVGVRLGYGTKDSGWCQDAACIRNELSCRVDDLSVHIPELHVAATVN